MNFMGRKLSTFIITAVLIGLIAAPLALAKVPTKEAGKSNTGHLYLCQKVQPAEEGVLWPCREDGNAGWGNLKYNLSGPTFDFVFNGHNLVPGENYTLIYYPDPWPGHGLQCLGKDTADKEGNVHIKGSIVTGKLPADGDANKDLDQEGGYGAKIWLVPSSHVCCEECSAADATPRMIDWDSDLPYLFEEPHGISYTPE